MKKYKINTIPVKRYELPDYIISEYCNDSYDWLIIHEDEYFKPVDPVTASPTDKNIIMIDENVFNYTRFDVLKGRLIKILKK